MFNKDRTRYWSLLLSKFLAGQGLTQLTNLVTGLLLLRLLPLEQYALYTIANVMLGMASVLADLGLSHGVMSIGARLREDRTSLSRLIASAQRYRWVLGSVAIVLLFVLTPFMTGKHGWSATQIGTVLLIITLSIWVRLVIDLRGTVFEIYHDADSVTRTDLPAALLRLAVTGISCAMFPLAVVALAANLFSLMVQSLLVARRARRYIDFSAPGDPAHSQALKRFFFPLIPSTLYYAFQGQISIFLISLFGSSTAIAQVGALGRLGQILGVLGALNGFFVLPYFARIASRELFVKRAALLLGALFLFGGILVLSAYVVPDWWLLILGQHYNDLYRELPVAIAASMIAFIAGIPYTLLIAKGATAGQHFLIYANLSIQVAFIGLIGVQSTYEAFLLNLVMALGTLSVNMILLIRMSVRQQSWAPAGSA